MSHTFSQNLVHVVFNTKERHKTIAKGMQPRLWAYSAGICQHLEILVHAIGGTEDHIHLLLQVPPKLSLANAVMKVKANSSGWMNEIGHKFEWQEGYGAFSVSASNLGRVKAYINNQERHHRKMSFEEEFVALLKKHKVAYDPRYVFG